MQDVIILDAKGYGSCCSFNCKTTNEKTTNSANGIFIVRNESQRKQNPRKKNQKFCLKYVCLQQPYLNELHYTKEKKRKRNAKTKQQNWLNLEFRHLFHFFFFALCIDFNLFKRNNARELLLLDLCKMLSQDFFPFYTLLRICFFFHIVSHRIW